VVTRVRVVVLLLLVLFSCRKGMFDQPSDRPLERNPMFADQNSSRPLVAGTVPYHYRPDELLENGTLGGQEANVAPFPVTLERLERGRQEFNIYCSPCHGVLANGRGMVVRRGFPPPPDFHTPEFRNAPLGHFVHVINNGFGVMFSYGDRVNPDDRWAIAMYIRALQESQNATVADVPAGALR
jgi:mono/diheme cytochrome c family protein